MVENLYSNEGSSFGGKKPNSVYLSSYGSGEFSQVLLDMRWEMGQRLGFGMICCVGNSF
jgi:hypothetical protein